MPEVNPLQLVLKAAASCLVYSHELIFKKAQNPMGRVFKGDAAARLAEPSGLLTSSHLPEGAAGPQTTDAHLAAALTVVHKAIRRLPSPPSSAAVELLQSWA